MTSKMFSPAIRVFSQENVDSVMRKPGTTNTLSRKPFMDRGVNSSPAVVKNLKSETQLKKSQPQLEASVPPKINSHEDDDLFFYDSYSFKSFEDNYLDIHHVSAKETANFLRLYCNYGGRTTPVKMFHVDDLDLSMDSPPDIDFKSEDKFMDLSLSIEDIPLPEIEFD